MLSYHILHLSMSASVAVALIFNNENCDFKRCIHTCRELCSAVMMYWFIYSLRVSRTYCKKTTAVSRTLHAAIWSDEVIVLWKTVGTALWFSRLWHVDEIPRLLLQIWIGDIWTFLYLLLITKRRTTKVHMFRQKNIENNIFCLHSSLDWVNFRMWCEASLHTHCPNQKKMCDQLFRTDEQEKLS